MTNKLIEAMDQFDCDKIDWGQLKSIAYQEINNSENTRKMLIENIKTREEKEIALKKVIRHLIDAMSDLDNAERYNTALG
jgi:hypothetical protein